MDSTFTTIYISARPTRVSHHKHRNMAFIWFLSLTFLVFSSGVSCATPKKPVNVLFDRNYVPTWAFDHIKYFNGGSEIKLHLDNYTGTAAGWVVKKLVFSHQTTPTTMFVSWSRLTGTGFQSKGFYLFGHFSMHIKLVPGDSAGTVTAFYVRFFISASYVLLLFNNVHACLTKHFVFDSCFSCLPKTRSTTRSTLSSWGTDQGSLIFFRQTYSREAVETGSRGSTYGSIRQKRTTPTPCCGTCTRLCK